MEAALYLTQLPPSPPGRPLLFLPVSAEMLLPPGSLPDAPGWDKASVDVPRALHASPLGGWMHHVVESRGPLTCSFMKMRSQCAQDSVLRGTVQLDGLLCFVFPFRSLFLPPLFYL